MEHKIIHTQNYLLIVDESETKVHGYKYCNDGENIKSVIAHLPLNNSPILEGVDLLPPLKDEAESLSLKSVNKRGYTTDDYQDGFEDGYNKAKEKYKYTEEDLRKAIEMAQECSICECFLGPHIEREHTEKSIIQSLQHHPKYPIAFEIEKGGTEWVGKYIYE
jgi:hypothetical protein